MVPENGVNDAVSLGEVSSIVKTNSMQGEIGWWVLSERERKEN